jgi:hypothetical protein
MACSMRYNLIKKGDRKMRNNFYPAKPFMLNNIERSIEAGNLDKVVFCESCAFKFCMKYRDPVCGTCTIRQGISRTTALRIINSMRKDEKVLGEIIELLKNDGHCKISSRTSKRSLHHLRKIMATLYMK